MGPGRLLIGPERCHWERRIFRQQASEIIGIRDADITLTGGNGLEDAGVAIDQGRVVGHQAAHHGLDFRLAKALDHGRQERLVIDVVGGPEAETVLPLRITEGFIG